MEQALLKAFEAKCTQDSPPACQAACPFHLDVRRFAAHMRDGQWQKARALLDKTLPYAALLSALCEHPCELPCLRQESGGAVAVGELERACVSLTPESPPVTPLPAKGTRVAVLGCGLAGLSAAWELSLKGHGVVLLYGGASPAAFLEDRLAAPDSFSSVPFFRLAEYLASALNSLKQRRAKFAPLELSTTGQGFEDLRAGYDALFVDVNAAGILANPLWITPLPDETDIDPVTGSVGKDYTLCFGGFASARILRAFEGRRGAITLSRILSRASPLALRNQKGAEQSRLHAEAPDAAVRERLTPSGDLFSAGEARREAARCLDCHCLRCIRACAYLRHYGGYPKSYARQMFLNMGIFTGYRRLNKQINSCALCGQCERICPERFSTAKLCLAMREEMVRQSKMPPSAHAFALQELESATSPECSLVLGGIGERTCNHVFFPGCQLAASRGGQVRFMFRHLRQTLSPDTGIWLRCCGIPAYFAARSDLVEEHKQSLIGQWQSLGQPRIIAACASCLRFFRDQLPELPVVSLWEVLDKEAGLSAPSRFAGLPFFRGSLHDPCAARHDRNWLASVRSLLDKNGIAWEEPAVTAEITACCGYGGLVWNANKDMAEMLARDRAKALPHMALTSCIMCRDRLAGVGKPALHLFDLLLPLEGDLQTGMSDTIGLQEVSGFAPAPSEPRNLPEPDWPSGLPTGREKGPGLSLRRVNRARLKRALWTEERVLHQEASGEAESVSKSSPESDWPSAETWSLHIAPELLEELEDKLILRQDLVQTVSRAEAEGAVFFNTAHTRYLARHKRGGVTFWVLYHREERTRVVLDAYFHRMDVGRSYGGDMPLSPTVEVSDEAWICDVCRLSLVEEKNRLLYMGGSFEVQLPHCPRCGQCFIPKELAEGKMREVEMLQEDK